MKRISPPSTPVRTHWHNVTPVRRLFSLLVPGLLSLSFLVAGCFLWSEDEASDDVCAGISHDFADTYFPGVTQAPCEAAENGEWLDGRCYCHGTD